MNTLFNIYNRVKDNVESTITFTDYKVLDIQYGTKTKLTFTNHNLKQAFLTHENDMVGKY